MESLIEVRLRLCKNCVDNEANHYKIDEANNKQKLICWMRLSPLDSQGKDCPYFREEEWYDKLNNRS